MTNNQILKSPNPRITEPIKIEQPNNQTTNKTNQRSPKTTTVYLICNIWLLIIALFSYFPTFGTLKKALHILLLSFYLLSCTELHELAKVPVLFQHYFEHKSIDSKITFLAYLEQHYNDVPHTDNDEDRDNQLPFKTHELFAGNVATPAIPPSFGAIPKKAYQILPKQKILINNDYIPNSAFAGKIWQPPKVVS